MESSLLLCLDLGFVLQLEVDFLSLITFCDVLIRLLMHFSCLLSGSGGQTTVASPEHCLTNSNYTLVLSKGIRLEKQRHFFQMASDLAFEPLLSVSVDKHWCVLVTFQVVTCPWYLLIFKWLLTIFSYCTLSSSQHLWWLPDHNWALVTKLWTRRRVAFGTGPIIPQQSKYCNSEVLCVSCSCFFLCVCVLPHSIEYIHFTCIYDTCCAFSCCTISNLCPSWLQATSRSVLASWLLHVAMPQTR